MWRFLWTAVGGIFALNAIVLAGIVVAATRQAHKEHEEGGSPDSSWRAGRRRVVDSARWRKASRAASRSGAGTSAGWLLVAALLLTGTAFASPQAREIVGSVLGPVAGGPEVGPGERQGEGGDRATVGIGARQVPSAVGTGPRNSTTGPGMAGDAGGSDPAAGSVPGPPPTVSAVAQSPTEIALLWTDVANETGYRVERRLTEVDWIEVAITDRGVTTVTDAGLLSDTTYFYRVFAINGRISSAPSDVTSATTTVDPPGPPTVTVSLASPHEIVLEWVDVASETGYRIERSSDGTTGWITIATTDQDVISYSDSGLSAEATFYYRIFATNAGGDSQASNVAWATTPTDTLPSEVADEPSP